MSASVPTPSLNIPYSKHTVEVCIIDTTTRINGLPVAAFMQPMIPGFQTITDGCSYSFIIKHNNPHATTKHDTLLFDLGTRKDFDNGPKVIVEQTKSGGFEFDVDKDVGTILKDHGDNPADVGAIIWSHYHIDHTGDPSTFPKSTALIVGPGFKSAFIPGWPTNEYSPLDEKAWEGRELREIDFEAESLTLGQYKAMDFYGDGTDPPEFILMGGDVAHHGGQFRPTQYVPLPENIKPNPLVKPFLESQSPCPGAIFQAIHPSNSSTEPFMQATGFIHDDAPMACNSIQNMLEFDAQENIFTMLAHDRSLADVVDFYPKSANNWKKLGWKEQCHWRFLRDFDTGS